MEPSGHSPSPSNPEMGPLPQASERVLGAPGTEVPRNKPEKAPEQSGESREQHRGGPSDPAFVAPPAAALPPVHVPAPAPPAHTAPASHGNPLLAADDDLIEKEWVERAKRIVSETRQDPYRQEQEVSKLQADYLKKRYGKEVKLPAD